MIEQFQKEYRFLSNFWPATVWLDTRFYPTQSGEFLEFRSVEHAFQCAKSISPEWLIFCKTVDMPGTVRRNGRHVKLREDWEDIKLDLMRSLVSYKFPAMIGNPLSRMLHETGDEYLQEGNFWRDKFWGVCLKTGEGENNLGKILMTIRDRNSIAFQ